MSNHLIIGLGGTGGKVIRELRKRIYEEFRSIDPNNGVRLDYIYVDSSPTDLDDVENWKVLGKSLALGNAQKVNINGIGRGMLDNLDRYPGMRCFITDTDRQLLQDGLGTIITAGIGGQRRRFGRMLLANNLCDAANDSNFRSVLRSAVSRLTAANANGAGDNNVTFYICAGLAGGTGSGSIVDVIAQVREMYPYTPPGDGRPACNVIRLFVYVPERILAHPDYNAGFYQANGYAALQEINALSTGHYHPYDITGGTDPHTGQVRRLLINKEAFQACYVYSNVNENNRNLDLGHGLPRAVADFMYQTIVVGGAADAGRMNRLLNCENRDVSPERDQGGEANRSRRFISFGITRVEYPETEIDEYFSYTYATQAVRQLIYNYWQEGSGYGSRPNVEIGIDYMLDVRARRDEFMISDSYLTLARPIILTDNTRGWIDFSRTFEQKAREFEAVIMREYPRDEWLVRFSNSFEMFYNRNFRGNGVANFFRIQGEEVNGYASYVRRNIEGKLFGQWLVGGENGKSIIEIERYATCLRGECNALVGEYNTKITELGGGKQNHERAIAQANARWGRRGWLRDAVANTSARILTEYANAKVRLYTCDASILAYRYAITLLGRIIWEIDDMIEWVGRFGSMMRDTLEEVVRQADSKCQVNAVQNDLIIKKYDPGQVREQARGFVANRDYQSNNANAIRTEMAENLGEEKTFRNLCERIGRERAMDIILDKCTSNARTALNDNAAGTIRVNILDKLRESLRNDDDIRNFVRNTIACAGAYAQFDREETARPLQNGEVGVMNMIQVAIPEADGEDATRFRDLLLDAFEQNVNGFDRRIDLSVSNKANQIVVVCAHAAFPLRYLTNLKTLKGRYDECLVGVQRDANKVVLHTETFVEPLPQLLDISREELRNMSKRPLLLAFALDLLHEDTNPATEERFLVMDVRNETIDDDEPIQVGRDFASCLENLSGDYGKFRKLSYLVDSTLRENVRTTTQRDNLGNRVREVLRDKILGSLCGGNRYDPRYVEYRGLAERIIIEELTNR